jgi:hypothetical protein
MAVTVSHLLRVPPSPEVGQERWCARSVRFQAESIE